MVRFHKGSPVWAGGIWLGKTSLDEHLLCDGNGFSERIQSGGQAALGGQVNW